MSVSSEVLVETASLVLEEVIIPFLTASEYVDSVVSSENSAVID